MYSKKGTGSGKSAFINATKLGTMEFKTESGSHIMQAVYIKWLECFQCTLLVFTPNCPVSKNLWNQTSGKTGLEKWKYLITQV